MARFYGKYRYTLAHPSYQSETAGFTDFNRGARDRPSY